MNESTSEEKKGTEEQSEKDEVSFTVNDRRHTSDTKTPEDTTEPSIDFSVFTPKDIEKLYMERTALSEELEQKRARLNELARGVQTLQHELDTRGARMGREQDKLVDMAKGQLLGKLLNVLDSFKHSLDSIPATEQTQPILDGVQMIYRQFLVELGDLGLQSYSAEGSKFDPERHSAIRNEDVQKQELDGTVLEVIRPGYSYRQRVLRPAEVVVGKYNAPAASTETEDEETPPEDQAST